MLDFGCGYGTNVWLLAERGYDARGVDISPYWNDPSNFGDGRPSAPRDLAARLSAIPLHPYQLPYPDQSIDVAISSQVFEHVADFVTTFRELGRVLKPNGISLHIVPARWRPIEGHTYIPLGTVWRSRWILGVWAWLGIRNSFQRGKSWREVRDLNFRYLNQHTFYPNRRTIRRYAREAGVSVAFYPREYLLDHPYTVGRIGRRFLVAAPLIEQLTQRVMVIRRA